MDNKLEESLRAILKEELEPINKRFESMGKDLKEIKVGQERLQKNVVENLGEYTDKIIDHFDNKTEALNKRVYATETDIQRLTRQ